MAQWDDDSYSKDLTQGFEDVLRRKDPGGDNSQPTAVLTNPKRVASSVGSFLMPNRFEFEVVGEVVDDLDGPATSR